MEQPATSRPTHRVDGGGPQRLELLGGGLNHQDKLNGCSLQVRVVVSNTFDTPLVTDDTTSDTIGQGSPSPVPKPARASYAHRLNAKAPAKAKTGVCRECGAKFQAHRATREFCRKECRQAFNNMQMSRGVLAYQLIMAHRYERDVFETAGGRKLLSRLASLFREDDNRNRGGRKSWDDFTNVLTRHPRLLATVVESNVAGLRRTERGK